MEEVYDKSNKMIQTSWIPWEKSWVQTELLSQFDQGFIFYFEDNVSKTGEQSKAQKMCCNWKFKWNGYCLIGKTQGCFTANDMIFYDEQGVSNIKRDARTKSIELEKHMLERESSVLPTIHIGRLRLFMFVKKQHWKDSFMLTNFGNMGYLKKSGNPFWVYMVHCGNTSIWINRGVNHTNGALSLYWTDKINEFNNITRKRSL